jgi:hypothetical protein
VRFRCRKAICQSAPPNQLTINNLVSLLQMVPLSSLIKICTHCKKFTFNRRTYFKNRSKGIKYSASQFVAFLAVQSFAIMQILILVTFPTSTCVTVFTVRKTTRYSPRKNSMTLSISIYIYR